MQTKIIYAYLKCTHVHCTCTCTWILHVSTCTCTCTSHFEQSGDGQSGNAPVAIGDEVLEVNIARGHGIRVNHGNPVERLDGGESDGRLSRGEEHLQHYELKRRSWQVTSH